MLILLILIFKVFDTYDKKQTNIKFDNNNTVPEHYADKKKKTANKIKQKNENNDNLEGQIYNKNETIEINKEEIQMNEKGEENNNENNIDNNNQNQFEGDFKDDEQDYEISEDTLKNQSEKNKEIFKKIRIKFMMNIKKNKKNKS